MRPMEFLSLLVIWSGTLIVFHFESFYEILGIISIIIGTSCFFVLFEEP